MIFDEDLALQLHLQEQVMSRTPSIMDLPDEPLVHQRKIQKQDENKNPDKGKTSLIDPSFEYIDPTPDVHAMFMQFNSRFFWGRLYAVEVRWSPRMTTCAGICCYEGRGGMCSIRLSAPLLKLRPRKDLVETLLHEMIHAYLFVTENNRDRDGHGPEFHKHMYRINKEAGTNITVYHDFHDEVRLYQQHWWRCNGPCQKWRPYFGMVKRAMNRPPGPTDFWWANHQAKCGGKFIKVREPEGYSKKKTSEMVVKGGATPSNDKNDIRNFFPGKGKVLSVSNSKGNGTILKNGKHSTSSNASSKKDLGNTDSSAKKKWRPNAVVGINSVTTGSAVGKAPGKTDASNGIRTLFDNDVSKNANSSRKTPVSNNNSLLPVGKPSGSKGKTFLGGMLANKGGGTMVITQKGNKQIQKNSDVTSDPSSHSPNSVGMTPFHGKGYTVGSKTRSSHLPAAAEKPWLSFLDKLEADNAKKQSSIVTVTNVSLTETSSTSDCNELRHSPPKKLKSSTSPNVDNDSNFCSKSRNFNVPPPLADGSVGVMVNCPMCDVLVDESAINSHLDICMQHDSASGVVPQKLGNCPICNKGFPVNQIEHHVDVCLRSNDSVPITKERVESEMIKCPMCDKQLLKCSLDEHLESCVQCVLQADACFIEKGCEDSDDATVCVSENSLHPCPVCMKLVKEKLMNAHLDECLSADVLKGMSQG